MSHGTTSQCARVIGSPLVRAGKGGLLMMASLFVIGPAVEILLINQLHLYEYTLPSG